MCESVCRLYIVRNAKKKKEKKNNYKSVRKFRILINVCKYIFMNYPIIFRY